MKKLTKGLTILLLGVAANSFAAVQSGTSPFSVCVPSLCGGFNIGVTGYWFRHNNIHTDYAVRYPTFVAPDPLDPLTFDPFAPFDTIFEGGDVHSVDNDHDHLAWRVNVGYVFPCSGNDITLAYTRYDNDDHDSVTRGTGVIFPTLTADSLSGILLFPDLIFTFINGGIFAISLFDIFNDFPIGGIADDIGGVPVDFASARTEQDYRAWDLEFGQYVNIGCNTRMRWFGGLRYAKLEHKLHALYRGSLTDVDVLAASPPIPSDAVAASLSLAAEINVFQNSNFEGIGPRFGLNTSYNFGGGFGIVGEASAALLMGEIDSHFRETENFAGTLTIDSVSLGGLVTATAISDEVDSFHHPDENRVVPNLEAKIGLDYSFVFCNKSKLTLEAGYFVTHYWNAVDRLSDVAVEFPEFRTRHTVDANFDGPYVSVQFQL